MSKAPIQRQLAERRYREIFSLLDAEQQHILGLVKNGKSVFITGEPGTGKSFLAVKIKEAISLFAPTVITGMIQSLSTCLIP